MSHQWKVEINSVWMLIGRPTSSLLQIQPSCLRVCLWVPGAFKIWNQPLWMAYLGEWEESGAPLVPDELAPEGVVVEPNRRVHAKEGVAITKSPTNPEMGQHQVLGGLVDGVVGLGLLQSTSVGLRFWLLFQVGENALVRSILHIASAAGHLRCYISGIIQTPSQLIRIDSLISVLSVLIISQTGPKYRVSSLKSLDNDSIVLRKPLSLRNLNNGCHPTEGQDWGCWLLLLSVQKAYNNPVSIAKDKHSPLRFGEGLLLWLPSLHAQQVPTSSRRRCWWHPCGCREQHCHAIEVRVVFATLRLVLAYKKPLRTKQQQLRVYQVDEPSWNCLRPQLASSAPVSVWFQSLRRSWGTIKVPTRQVVNDILTKQEVSKILDYLKTKDEWYYPIFYTWLSTGLRNSELIGLTWDAVDLEAGEIRITKTLRRWMDSNTQREWSDTKNRKHRIVPLTDGAVEVLRQHQTNLQRMGLMEPTGVVFLTKKNHQYLYDLLLERVWKRTLESCGIRYRKLYSQRHTFLSHMLASGNSPADVAAIAGHRLDELLKTYAKPTGRLKLVDWWVNAHPIRYFCRLKMPGVPP